MATDTNMQQYLTFSLKKQVYGVPIAAVREINRMAEITAVPRSPSFMAGVMNLRGKVIPVLDLRLKLEMERIESTKSTCIVVVECASGDMGVIVDQVNSVIELKHEQIEKAPQLGGGADTNYVLGMGKIDDTIVILLDIFTVLSNEELSKMTRISESQKVNEAQKAA